MSATPPNTKAWDRGSEPVEPDLVTSKFMWKGCKGLGLLMFLVESKHPVHTVGSWGGNISHWEVGEHPPADGIFSSLLKSLPFHIQLSKHLICQLDIAEDISYLYSCIARSFPALICSSVFWLAKTFPFSSIQYVVFINTYIATSLESLVTMLGFASISGGVVSEFVLRLWTESRSI